VVKRFEPYITVVSSRNRVAVLTVTTAAAAAAVAVASVAGHHDSE